MAFLGFSCDENLKHQVKVPNFELTRSFKKLSKSIKKNIYII